MLASGFFLFLSVQQALCQSFVPAPADAVCEPVYELKDGRTLTAGKAVAVKLQNGRVVLLTVMHSFGPAGGLDSIVPPQSVPDFIAQTTLQDPETGKEVGRAGAELLIGGDGYPADADYSKDLAAFDLTPGYQRRVFTLYPNVVKVGTQCWLDTYTAEHESRQVPAVVVASSARALILKLGQSINTHATSGSPVFAVNGTIIGILRGHDEAGRIFCNPSFRIKQRLESELPAK